MRTFDEQAAEIRSREAKIRKKRNTREAVFFSVLSCGISAVLILVLIRTLPALENGIRNEVPPYYGTIFSANPIVGFAVIVVLAFALGICVTLLGIRIRNNRERQDKES